MKYNLLLPLLLAGTAAGAAELLPNGTFEQKFKGWHYADYAGKPEPGAVVSDIVYGGNFAYRMGISGDKGNDLYTGFKPVPGQDHQVTLMWKADGLPPGDAEIRILRNGGGKVIGWASNPAGSGVNRLAVTGGTHDWRQVKFTVSGSEFPPEVTGANLYVKRGHNGIGNLYVDEISIRPVVPAPAAPADRLDRWEYEKWRKIPAPGGIDRAVTRSGGGSYCMFAPGQKGASIYQRIPFRPGEGLELSFYLKAEKVPDKDASFMILVNHKNKKTSWIAMPPGSGVNVLGTAGGTFDWREFRLSIPADAIPEDAASLLFFLKRRQNDAGKLYIDDFTAAPPQAEKPVQVVNLWPGDGSFEGGSTFFQLPPDETRAFHGRRSLRMEPAQTGLTSGYLFRVMRPNRTYTVSGYATSDRPGKLTVKADSHKYETIGTGSVELTPGEWKRFTVRLRPQQLVSSFRLGFTKPEGAAVWLDAFQLAEGDAAGTYVPETPLAIGVDRTGVPGEILYTGPEPLVQAARLHNSSGRPMTVKFTASVDAFGTPARRLASETVTLAPGETAVRPLTVLSRREAGYYVLRLRGEADGKGYKADFPLAVTAPPPPKGGNPFFGLHPMGPTSPEILRRIGVGAIRHMPGWRYIPEKDGKYRFSNHDIRYALAGMDQMNSVKVGLVPPRYRRPDGRFADHAAVNEFLADFCIEKERYYYGLWRNTLPLPAAPAYAASAQWLEGAKPGETVSDSDIQCFTYLDRNGRPFAALWTADGTPTKARIPLDAARLEAADFFNRPLALKQGPAELALSGAPVYLRLREGAAAELAAALRQAKYDLPPVSAGWRLRNGSTVELTLANRRTAPLTGKAVLSGAEFREPERPLALQPGEETTQVFAAPGSLNGKELTLRVDSTLGELTARYRAEFLPCPAGRPDFRSPELPAAGRLPSMASRDYLIPNDPENGYDGPADLSIESAIGHDSDNLYLAINVRDDVHSQPFSAGKLWAADSIQLVIDTRADALPNVYGFAPDDYEMSFGLTPNGPDKEFDYIYERGRAAASQKQVECNIFRSGDLTCYRIAIPWKVLNMEPAAGTVFGLNFIANDHDGHGRNYWMGLTPGIGEAKNPYAYRKFILQR